MSDFVSLHPTDEYNQQLQANTHPKDWVNPRPTARYNLVVLGGGTAGLVAAAGAANLGAKVALVERALLGGDCLHVGCVPSKALIGAARRAADLNNAYHFGVKVPSGVQVDFPAAMARMRRLRTKISQHDSAARFRELGVDVYLGDGRFCDGRTLEVAGETLPFCKAVIATGAQSAIPPIAGLEQVRYLTHETIFSLTQLPRRLGIIGAGPIGCELAQSFARFGSHVNLIERNPGILPREDQDAAAILEKALRQEGVHLSCGVERLRVTPNSHGISLHFTSQRHQQQLIVDQLLVAAGRQANVDCLNLTAAGVAYDRATGVKVNDHLQTTNPRIYAAGDVCSRYQFTHAADFMARLVLQNALFFGRAKVSDLTIPWCTYTSPEIAHVGVHPQQADRSPGDLDTFMQPLAEVDRAILAGETEGFVKIHLKKGSDQILGATIVAPHAGETISEIVLAMTHRLGLKKIASTIHPYPTCAEAIRQVADRYNRTRLTPLVKSLLIKWLSWTR